MTSRMKTDLISAEMILRSNDPLQRNWRKTAKADAQLEEEAETMLLQTDNTLKNQEESDLKIGMICSNEVLFEGLQ